MSGEGERVKETIQSFLDSYKKEDFQACRQIFHDDISIIPPEGPSIKGVDNIMKLTQEVHERGITEAKHTNQEVKVYGSMAVYHADFAFNNSTGDQVQKGKTLGVFIKDEATGNWKQTHEMWTTGQ